MLGLIALRLHALAWGTAALMLLLAGILLVWLYRRYQASPLAKEKRDLQLRSLHIQGQMAEEQQRLNEARKRRDHLLRKEQFGLEATLLNMQQHHVEKGLTRHPISDATLPGIGSELKVRLIELGIRNALDVSEHAVNQVPGVDASKREVLLGWRTMLCDQLDATKPDKLPDHQLEYIQKKFRRLHNANDEKERTAAYYHQELKGTLDANELQLKQLMSITFWGFLAESLTTRDVKEHVNKSSN
jgi:DNA-binding helix-hairpin-helix protein with protein kinase domain